MLVVFRSVCFLLLARSGSAKSCSLKGYRSRADRDVLASPGKPTSCDHNCAAVRPWGRHFKPPAFSATKTSVSNAHNRSRARGGDDWFRVHEIQILGHG